MPAAPIRHSAGVLSTGCRHVSGPAKGPVQPQVAPSNQKAVTLHGPGLGAWQIPPAGSCLHCRPDPVSPPWHARGGDLAPHFARRHSLAVFGGDGAVWSSDDAERHAVRATRAYLPIRLTQEIRASYAGSGRRGGVGASDRASVPAPPRPCRLIGERQIIHGAQKSSRAAALRNSPRFRQNDASQL